MGLVRSVRVLKYKDSILLRFTIKTSIVGGIVYYTYVEGLWSKPEETAKLYEKIYVNVAPYVKENVPKEVAQQYAQLPSVSTLKNCAVHYWNRGVITSMKFTADLPTHTMNGATNLYKTVEKYINQQN